MIVVEYRRIVPFDFTSEPVDFLLGVKDERVTIEIKFKAEWKIQSDGDNKSVFAGNTIRIDDIDDEPIIDIWGRQEFRVGDVIGITGSASNNVTRNITAISSDGSTITVDGAALTGETSTDALINGETVLIGTSFKYNFIENSASINFFSLVDGNENKYSIADNSDTNFAQTIHRGQYKSNKIGDVQIKSTGNLNEFIILQSVNIVPFTLSGQLFDIQNDIAPEYYFDLNCLRYVFEITLHKALNDPNYIHQTVGDLSKDGNTGNFGENFNGGPPQFVLASTVFKDESDNVIAAPDFSKINKVEITLSSIDAIFQDTQQLFTLQHSYIPVNSSEHTNTTTDMEFNFMFDQNVKEIEAGTINGRGFGTEKQVLKDFEILYINASEVLIKATIDFSDEYKLRLESLDGNFYLGVTTQTFGLPTIISNKVHVLASKIAYTVDKSDSASGGIENCFISQAEESTESTGGVRAEYSRKVSDIQFFLNGDSEFIYNQKVIGAASWQGSELATAERLRESINDGVAYGPVFQAAGHPLYPFDGTTGWTSYIGVPSPPNAGEGNSIIMVAPEIGLQYNFVFPDPNTHIVYAASGSFSGGALQIILGEEYTTVLICTDNAGVFVEDWQIGKTTFFVEDPADSKIKNIKVRIFAKHATFGEFDLEVQSFNVDNAPIVSGVQVINLTSSRGYKMKAGNIFNNISIVRNASLDTGTRKYYELLYSFKIRWEDFTALPSASDQFFDPAELNNGKNNNWNRYYAEAGWTLLYKTSVTITKDDFDNVIEAENDLTALDYGGATDWEHDTASFDVATETEITGNVLKDQQSLIKVRFKKTFGLSPDLSEVSGLLGVAPEGAGGAQLIREISKPHEKETGSPWISIDNNGKPKIEKIGDDFFVSAILDNVKLRNIFPTAKSFDITGRINEPITDDIAFLLETGNEGLLLEDGTQLLFE